MVINLPLPKPSPYYFKFMVTQAATFTAPMGLLGRRAMHSESEWGSMWYFSFSVAFRVLQSTLYVLLVVFFMSVST